MSGEPEFSLREKENASVEWKTLRKNPILIDLRYRCQYDLIF